MFYMPKLFDIIMFINFNNRRLELLIGYGQITVNVCNISHLVELPTDLGSPLESKPVPEDTILTLTSDLGIIQQLTQLFNTI